jgi:hypothetical protein
MDWSYPFMIYQEDLNYLRLIHPAVDWSNVQESDNSYEFRDPLIHVVRLEINLASGRTCRISVLSDAKWADVKITAADAFGFQVSQPDRYALVTEDAVELEDDKTVEELGEDLDILATITMVVLPERRDIGLVRTLHHEEFRRVTMDLAGYTFYQTAAGGPEAGFAAPSAGYPVYWMKRFWNMVWKVQLYKNRFVAYDEINETLAIHEFSYDIDEINLCRRRHLLLRHFLAWYLSLGGSDEEDEEEEQDEDFQAPPVYPPGLADAEEEENEEDEDEDATPPPVGATGFLEDIRYFNDDDIAELEYQQYQCEDENVGAEDAKEEARLDAEIDFSAESVIVRDIGQQQEQEVDDDDVMMFAGAAKKRARTLLTPNDMRAQEGDPQALVDIFGLPNFDLVNWLGNLSFEEANKYRDDLEKRREVEHAVQTTVDHFNNLKMLRDI